MHRRSVSSLFGLLLLFGVAGCYRPGAPTDAAGTAGGEVHTADDGHGHGHPHGTTAGTKHDHSGWWCPEHGIPEAECAQCNTKLAAEMKAQGDWCDKHTRPASQCFICTPELQAKFAKLYERKYGKAPPPIE